MNIYFLNCYNNLIKLTTNKSLYTNLTNNQDTFKDRLFLFLFHFAFILKTFKNTKNKKSLQELYDFIFKQLELSIREIGYGDQSINKKMKIYINYFHSIITEIHYWEDIKFKKKNECLSKFFENFTNFKFLVDYFDKFNSDLKKYDLNSYLKSVVPL